jgi:coenzyme F420-0:L-glutamate ligase
MEIFAIPTPLLRTGDDIARILVNCAELQENDILVISSKALATIEGRTFQLEKCKPSAQAKKLSKKCGQSPAFTEIVLQETKRMRGVIAGVCPYALLTSLKPKGMKRGRILCPNAGLDKSNIVDGSAIGWPENPVTSAESARKILRKLTGKNVGIIVSDSCCRPGRLGVTAFALTVSGFDPLRSEVGRKDLFGKPLKFTHEAVADQLATAANAVMGNANQSTPAAVIRNHGISLNNFSGWVPGIEPREDLFRSAFE